MGKAPAKPMSKAAASRVLGPRAFAAITAVEGLKLGKTSRERLKSLQDDASLTPSQRRAAVLKTYQQLSRKK